MGQEQSKYDASSGSKQLGMSFHLCLRLLFPLSAIYVNLFKNSIYIRHVYCFLPEQLTPLYKRQRDLKYLACYYCSHPQLKNLKWTRALFLLSGKGDNVRQNWARYWTRKTGQNKKTRLNDGSFFIRLIEYTHLELIFGISGQVWSWNVRTRLPEILIFRLSKTRA